MRLKRFVFVWNYQRKSNIMCLHFIEHLFGIEYWNEANETLKRPLHVILDDYAINTERTLFAKSTRLNILYLWCVDYAKTFSIASLSKST